jgi:uncharacterized membrane protein YdfJ with MMPL/SSD domain
MSLIPEKDLLEHQRALDDLKVAIGETLLVRFIVRHRWPILIASVIIVAAIYLGAILGYIPTEPHR